MLVLRPSLYRAVLLLLGLSLFISTQLSAQSPDFVEYKRGDGLHTSALNFHLLQDSKGFIWGCSTGGLVRYDGTEFKSFGPKDGFTRASVLRSIEDPRGRIWVLCYNGEIYFYENGRFHQRVLSEEVLKLTRRDFTWHFQVDCAENIYLATRYRGLWKLDTADSLTNLVAQEKGQHGLAVWFSDDLPPMPFGLRNPDTRQIPDTVLIFDDDFNRSGSIPFRLNYLHQFRPFFYEIEKGLIALTYGNHIFKLSKEEGVVDYFECLPWRIGINSVCISQNGDWWVATNNFGMLRFNGGILDSAAIDTISFEHTFNWVMEDREGGIWSTVYGHGWRYMPNPFADKITVEDGDLPETYVINVIGSDSCYFIEARSSFTYQYQFSTGKFREIEWQDDLDPPAKAAVHMMYLDRNNDDLYMAFESDRLTCFSDGVFEEITSPDFRNMTGKIQSIHSHPDSSIWIFGYRGGIRYKDGVILEQTPILDEFIGVITLAPNGDVYMGTNKGIWKYDGDAFQSLKEKGGVFNSYNYDIVYHNEGLWISSPEQGLHLYRGDSLFRVGNRKDPIEVAFLHPEEDTIWALGGQALYKIIDHQDSFTFHRHIVNFDGNVQISGFSYYKDRFYFGSTNGLTTFSKNELGWNKVPPKIEIASIKIHDKDTVLLPNYDLTYDQDIVQISFAGLSYRSPEIIYRYRLIGVDEDWRNTLQKSIQYTKLPPGDYQFEVYANSLEQLESLEPATFSFTIHPPVWGTWWFRILTGLIILLVLVLIVRRRIKQVEDKRLFEVQLHQLESKALRAQINPHFIFNVLGAIQGFVLESDANSSEKYLSKFARLIRLILENSRKSYVSLDQELEMLHLYLDMEQMRFKNRMNYQITIDKELVTDRLEVPPMLVQPFVENAVIHGLENKEEGGIVNILFERRRDVLRCEIADNGIGFKQSQALKEEQRKHQPLGMLITKERLQLLNDQSGKDLEVSFIDRKEEGKSGTKVVLNIPIRETF